MKLIIFNKMILRNIGIVIFLVGNPTFAISKNNNDSTKYVCGMFQSQKVRIPVAQIFFVIDYEKSDGQKYAGDCTNLQIIRSINFIYKMPNVEPLTNTDWHNYFNDQSIPDFAVRKQWIDLAVDKNLGNYNISDAINNSLKNTAGGSLYKSIANYARYKHYQIDKERYPGDYSLRSDIYYNNKMTQLITCTHSKRELINKADIGVCILTFYSPVMKSKVQVNIYNGDILKSNLIVTRLNKIFATLIVK